MSQYRRRQIDRFFHLIYTNRKVIKQSSIHKWHPKYTCNDYTQSMAFCGTLAENSLINEHGATCPQRVREGNVHLAALSRATNHSRIVDNRMLWLVEARKRVTSHVHVLQSRFATHATTDFGIKSLGTRDSDNFLPSFAMSR